MSAKKEDHGPGLAPAIFLGFLTFVIGAVLGTVSMISQDVRMLTKTANKDDLEPGTVYFIRGDRLGRSTWEAKEQAWKAGTANVLTVSESELNQWSSRNLQVKRPAAPPEDASWMDKLEISATPVNFRILEDKIQVATELKVPELLGDRSFLYQVMGEFVEQEGTIRFVPSTGTLGCAPVGSFPGVKDVLFTYVSSLFAEAEAGDWLPESIQGLSSVDISEGQLVLRRG